jgi:hypothetical protein
MVLLHQKYRHQLNESGVDYGQNPVSKDFVDFWWEWWVNFGVIFGFNALGENPGYVMRLSRLSGKSVLFTVSSTILCW